MSADLPHEVRSFLRTYVDSLEQLEVLLHLSANETRAFSCDEVTRDLRLNAASVQRRLDRLTSLGLLQVDAQAPPVYRFGPAHNALRTELQEVARCFKETPSRVISFIFSGPVAEVVDFADAFKLKKDKRDG